MRLHERAFHKPHHVGVLFDRTRFTQVRELRTFAALFFDFTAELCQCNDRNLEFLRQNFKATGNRTDSDCAVFFFTRLHQLQVVDDKQIEMPFVLELARLAHEFHNAKVGVIIDEQRRLVNQRHGRENFSFFVIIEFSATNTALVNLRLRTEQTLGKLNAIHFKAEESHIPTIFNSRVCSDRHGKRSFTHTRTRRQNNQVRILEAVCQSVQFRNSSRNPRNTILMIIETLQKRRHKVVNRL